MAFKLQNLKEEHRPLSRYRIVSYISIALLFVAFLLFLLVSLSLTIIKPIYLLQISSTVPTTELLSLATELRFGVWGVCATSTLDPATVLDAGLCFGPALGYTAPSYLASDIGVSSSVLTIIQKALLVILVLHPVVAGLSLISLLLSLFLASHVFSIFTLIVTIVTALVSTVVFGVDLALVLVARAELANLSGSSIDLHLEVDWGNAVWMVLVGMILEWAAVGALSARACYCLGVRRHPNDRPWRQRKNQDPSSTPSSTSSSSGEVETRAINNDATTANA